MIEILYHHYIYMYMNIHSYIYIYMYIIHIYLAVPPDAVFVLMPKVRFSDRRPSLGF